MLLWYLQTLLRLYFKLSFFFQVAKPVEGILISKDNNPNEDSYIQPDEIPFNEPKEFENLTFCEEASFYDVDVENPSSSVKVRTNLIVVVQFITIQFIVLG